MVVGGMVQLLRVGIGFLLIATGVAKLLVPEGASALIRALTSLPPQASTVAVTSLAIVEVTVGIALILAKAFPLAASLSTALFLVFAVVKVGARTFLHWHASCGCFGRLSSQEISLKSIVATVGLAGASFLLLKLGTNRVSRGTLSRRGGTER